MHYLSEQGDNVMIKARTRQEEMLWIKIVPEFARNGRVSSHYRTAYLNAHVEILPNTYFLVHGLSLLRDVVAIKNT